MNGRNVKLKVALIERCGTLAEANLRLGWPRGSERLSRAINGRARLTAEEQRKIAWLTQKPLMELFPKEEAAA